MSYTWKGGRSQVIAASRGARLAELPEHPARFKAHRGQATDMGVAVLEHPLLVWAMTKNARPLRSDARSEAACRSEVLRSITLTSLGCGI
jgi:hypothetical protein